MKTYQVELKRTTYINLSIEAKNEDEAEELAWKEIKSGDYRHEDASWDIECIEVVTQGESA